MSSQLGTLSQLVKPPKLEEAISEYKSAKNKLASWRREIVEDIAFKNGKQWKESSKSALEESGKYAFVFNYCKPLVDLCMGINEQNPIEARVAPIHDSDVFLAQIYNEIVSFIDNKINAEDVENEALEDAATCGIGYVQINVSTNPKNPFEILISEENVMVDEVVFDPTSQKTDLSDARYIYREKWISKEDFKLVYPEHADKIDEIFGEKNLENPVDDIHFNAHGNIDLADLEEAGADAKRNLMLDVDFYDKENGLVKILIKEYKESFKRYYGYNPMSQRVEEFDEKNLESLKEKIKDFDYDYVWDTKIKWLHCTADMILYDDDSPIPYQGFSIVPITAYRDKSKKPINYYGIIRNVKDPQREINKRWSHAIFMLTNQGQGVMAEKDAFVDPLQAQQSWADITQITWVNKGMLNRIQEKPRLEFPTASIQMEQFAQEAIKRISGINPDLLGIAGQRQEPGVVVKMRQQQGLVILAPLFKRFKIFKETLLKIKLAIISKYMPDSQILKILDGTGKYVIKDGFILDQAHKLVANIRDVKDLNYKTQVIEKSGNLTRRMADLSVLLQMAKDGMPVDPKLIIKKLDISADEMAEWMAYVDQQQAMQQQAAQAAQAAQQQELAAKMQTQLAAEKIRVQPQIMSVQMKAKNQQMRADAQKQKEMIEFQRLKAEQLMRALEISENKKRDLINAFIELAQMSPESRMLVDSLLSQLYQVILQYRQFHPGAVGQGMLANAMRGNM